MAGAAENPLTVGASSATGGVLGLHAGLAQPSHPVQSGIEVTYLLRLRGPALNRPVDRHPQIQPSLTRSEVTCEKACVKNPCLR